MSDRRWTWALIAVILFGVALHFWYGFVRVGYSRMVSHIGADGEDYLRIAYTLAWTDRYERPGPIDVKGLLQTRPAVLPPPPGGPPDSWRPPVWPWVLSRWLRWSGYDLRAVFALRYLLDGLTLFLFYRVASPWLKPPLAVLGTLLVAIHPAWLIYSVILVAEPLVLFTQLLFTFAMLRLAGGGRPAVWLPASGVLGGITILTHPFFLFFPPLLTAGLWIGKRLRLAHALALLGLFALTLAPWLVRNGRLYGTTSPILTSSTGVNLAKGWNRDFLRVFRFGSENDLDENVGIDPAELKGLNQAERSALYTSRAVQYVRSEWRTVPAILGKKLVGAFTPFTDPRRLGILETGKMLFYVIILVPLLWVVFAGGNQPLPSAYLLTVLLCFPAPRYRVPLLWAEVLSLCLFLQAFLAWRRSP
jgi:4-amino-4-deoxy-L-arabinose transferase-like glycosyltransferase